MGLHEKAWSGLNILIFGSSKNIPMQIEQAIANAAPSNETKIDSFESYEDAIDHCKNRKDVGLILILENCGKLPILDVFQQLSKPYKSRGWPCLGVVLYEQVESVQGLKAIANDKSLFDYRNISDFIDPERTSHTLDIIWSKFSASFENLLLPTPLQESLLSVSEKSISASDLNFLRRTAHILSGNLNISWIETVALKWAPVVESVTNSDPLVMAPHASLTQICKLASWGNDPIDLNCISTQKNTLCARISAMSRYLNNARISGSLQEELFKISARSNPTAPALIRHTAAMKERILDVADQENQSKKSEKAA